MTDVAMSVGEGKRLKFGLVGCGAIGPTHAASLRQLADVADLVAVADLVPERAKKIADQFGVKKIYKTGAELIADGEVEAVSFCTPSGMHADQAVKAMKAGKHVVVEKPMDVSLAACDRMISAERETGKKLAIISQHRFDHASIFVRDAIQKGKLGKLVLVDMSVKWYRTQQYYDSGDWRGTWAMDGGGALMNQGVHTVDLLQWLAGPIESLRAHIVTGAHERIEVEDTAVASLKFKNGAIGTLTASTACYSGQPARIDIYGTAGSAIIEGDRLKYFNLKDGTQVTAEEASHHARSVASGGTASVKDQGATRLGSDASKDPGAVWGDAHTAQLRDFIHAINTGGRPLIHGAEGRKPVEIILAVYESAKRGKEVTL
jgi:predicted dehydrogenase